MKPKADSIEQEDNLSTNPNFKVEAKGKFYSDAQLEAMMVKERIDELENVYGLMENDITLWTDAEGLPLRVGERIGSLKSRLKDGDAS